MSGKDKQSDEVPVTPATSSLTEEEVAHHRSEAQAAGNKLREQARLLAEMAQVEARERHNAVIQKQIQELIVAREKAKESSPLANKVLIQEDPDTAKFRVATAQGKQGIWLLTFPDTENTGNLVN